MYESDEEYRECFLRFFQLDNEYDEKKIGQELDRLYDLMSVYQPFSCVLKKLVCVYMNLNESEVEKIGDNYLRDGFMYLFSYDHLYSMAKCVEDYTQRNEIKKEYLDDLIRNV